MNLAKLYTAGATKRWHTQTTVKEQDLAAHSWGVAMIIMAIAPTDNKLLRAALVHDLHEAEAGDVPYPFKAKNPAVKRAYDLQDEEFRKRYNIYEHLSPAQERLLKWADMFELLLWTKRELEMGNQTIRYVIDVAYRALRDMGHPNDTAKQLFEEATK